MDCKEEDEKHDLRASKRDEKFKEDQKAMHESVYQLEKMERYSKFANYPCFY